MCQMHIVERIIIITIELNQYMDTTLVYSTYKQTHL